ncbi:MAG: PQQ-binding-like beta-propeller repeat protein [Anaerolineaceae bacterium]|nr:PQQ-binding-like beta-propeller repeat protein [Anaerolineaceae bacterium]
MKKDSRKPRQAEQKRRHIGRWIILGVVLAAAIAYVILFVPFGSYDFSAASTTPKNADGTYSYSVPLDASSPWPKFRANELQNGRVSVQPTESDLRPWSYRTGKGIFSSPVVDGQGNVYIGSADTYFYKFGADGSVLWKVKTGGIIDSSALLDDQGRVYVGSGDSNVYCIDRESGAVIWKAPAHSVEDVEKLYGIKTYNVNWFEGNIGLLPDGSLVAPNDNYLVYTLDRATGEKRTVFPANEMIWSLPALNINTGKLFFATANQILKNVYSYDLVGNPQWTTGSFGTVAATSMLTNDSAKGAVLVGGFDGFLRAFAQDSGKLLWKFGTKDHIYASPAQLSDGTIVQASTDGTLYAIDPASGKAIWEFDTLEPIRSSPAVDGNDNIYFGNGEGKLYCINPDGTLRWSYQLITDERNDLNGSPALGETGVYIAGESGEVFFVPYDYPLTPVGQVDARSFTAGENMPEDGAYFVYTTSFGALKLEPEKAIDANAPLTFTLMVRANGDNVLSALDRGSVKVEIAGNSGYRVEVGATNKFVNIVPVETWKADADGNIVVHITGTYKTHLMRFGLKFFGGFKAGTLDETYTFKVNSGSGLADPFKTAVQDGQQSVLEFSRLSAPIPSMLPSYNQIGFDSLHYVAGLVNKNSDGKAIVWVIEGKLDDQNKTVIDPAAITRYPLVLDYDNGLVTLANYEGFKIKFIGSWDMPFANYRLSDSLGSDGKFTSDATLIAVANCDQIEFYGIGLKLVGMSEFKTGQMFVRGATRITQWPDASAPQSVGQVTTVLAADKVTAQFSGTGLMANAHVYSILLADADGNPLPLYYTKNTSIEANADGMLSSITLKFDKDEDVSSVKSIYVLVDTYPVYSGK